MTSQTDGIPPTRGDRGKVGEGERRGREERGARRGTRGGGERSR